MEFPEFTMRQLMEAGVHYGHTPRRWNAKMEPYIFGFRNGVHILDLRQTMPLLQKALQAVYEVGANGGRVLFVATKRQAQAEIAEAAQRCGQPYVNFRWLGGMMTNWQTITNSIQKLKNLDVQLADEALQLTKKERLKLTRDREKLERALGGIREMSGLPDIVVVIDSIKESIAIQEANKLGIPVVAVIDSNSDPDGIDYPVPGNDDALRSIKLYCDLMAQAVLAGLKQSVMQSGADTGEAENPDMEKVVEASEAPAEAVAEAPAEAVAEAAAEAPAEAEAKAPVKKAKAKKAKAKAKAAKPKKEEAKDE